ncbi:hypothetical protein ACLOJK_023251, partial [Asimina triloba]
MVTELTIELDASKAKVAQLREQVIDFLRFNEGVAELTPKLEALRMEFKPSRYAHDGFMRALAEVSSLYQGKKGAEDVKSPLDERPRFYDKCEFCWVELRDMGELLAFKTTLHEFLSIILH